jgi:hypothetical protein
MLRQLCCLTVVVTLSICLINCAADPTLSTITIIPNGNVAVNFAGEHVQFRAMGTYVRGSHPQTTRDITDQVTWESSNPSVATVDPSGLATAIGAGAVAISASMGKASSVVMSSVNLSVAGGAPISLLIIPAPRAQTLHSIGETAQFIAIGSFDTNPTTQDMTNQVVWESSDVKVATINSAGLATAVFGGTTTIIAISKSASGPAITATSDLTVVADGGVSLPTLAVYKVGLGTGTVVSIPNGIACGSGAACTGNFVLGSAVKLTATPDPGSEFGGWSANCTPSAPSTLPCTITMNNNDSVGAIFNLTPP